MALGLARAVGEEGRALHAALEACQLARGAGVEDRDAHVRREPVERRPQLAVGQALAAKQEAALVGVAGVIEDQLDAQAGRARLLQQELEPLDGREEAGAIGVEHQETVGLGHPAELAQDAVHRFGVAVGVVQQRAAGAPVVVPDQQREAAQRGAGLRRGCRGEGQGEDGSDQGAAFRNTRSRWCSVAGRGSGSRSARAGDGASVRAAVSTAATSNGSAEVTKMKRSNAGASSSW